MILRLFYTFRDIGIYRIILRLRYEILNFIERLYPYDLNKFFYKKEEKFKIFKFRHKLIFKKNYEEYLTSELKPLKINSINEIIYMNNSSIDWNPKNKSRLYIFNLHYFEWIKEYLNRSLKDDYLVPEIKDLKKQINDWIDNNIYGKGDGWHSYTISLRIRNWILLISFFPNLANPKITKSIWDQINWLSNHKEFHLGGNHLLENLITILIGSTQFQGKVSDQLFEKNIRILEKELKEQILNDGGHYERSAGYHIQILDRLVLLGFFIQKFKKIRPSFLILAISKMYIWTSKVRLNNNNFPNFNDSNKENNYQINEIIDFALAFLKNYKINNKDLRSLITKDFYINAKEEKLNIIEENYIKNEDLILLPDTGWTIVKLRKNWEICIKNGISSPKYLPGHSHSDLITFDIFFKGKPIIIEAGTGTYENNLERIYERSSSAHNVFQIGFINKKQKITWVEPIDIWHSFRAGRKAKVIKNNVKNTKNLISFEGEHDAYKYLGVSYQRNFDFIKKAAKNSLRFKLTNIIESNKKVVWREWWHLAPNQPKEILDSLIIQYRTKYKNLISNIEWHDTFYSKGINNKIQRKSLCISGILLPGKYNINSDIEINVN